MKRLITIFALVASAVSVGFCAVSDVEFKEMQGKCYDKMELNSCEKLCDLKDGDGCAVLAVIYNGEENYPKVFHYAQIACDLESALGCSILGLSYAEGKGVAKDIEKGYDLVGKAVCDLKLNMPAKFFNEFTEMKPSEVCYELGVQYLNGQEVAPDYSKAAHYYQISCEAKNADGCFWLGILYENGWGVEKNFVKAREYYKTTCDLKNGNGCNNLGYLYENGRGVRLDFAKASQYYKSACDLKNEYGCNNLGRLYRNGQGVKANKNKAKEYFGKACDLGFQSGCDSYKEMVNPTPTASSSEETPTPRQKRAIEWHCDDDIGKWGSLCDEWAKIGMNLVKEINEKC